MGVLAEHRDVFETALRLAGLPSAAWDTTEFSLRTFTGELNEDGSDKMVQVDGEDVLSIAPVDFAEARRVIDRPGPATIGEFAQSPDFSYALWDWASGNESCPLEIGFPQPTDAVTCHDFKFHMGPVNSNHFLPQAGKWWGHYHGLAVERARACNALATRLGSERDRFRPVLRACERQALVLEAVAQHFLQDAWAMGHMWERWGSPDPSDFFANRKGAVFVGLITGIFHGARSVVQPIFDHLGGDVNDPMSAPGDGVDFAIPPDVGVHPGVGDEYLATLQADSTFAEQLVRLERCTVSSIREVYGQLASPELGPMSAPAAGTCCVDPVTECFGQRATNQALFRGAGIDYRYEDGPQLKIELTPELTAALLVKAASDGIPECAGDEALYTAACREAIARTVADLVQAVTTLTILAKEDPYGVQAASGALGSLGNYAQNSVYLDREPVYMDPPLPWRGDGAAPDPRAAALARTFHEAHAGDWCDGMNAAYLRRLKQHVLDASEASPQDPVETEAATEACRTFAQRHVRAFSGTGAQTGGEPLCRFAAEDPDDVAYLDRVVPTGGTPATAASSWCTCGNGALDPGEECDASASEGDAACPGACAAPFHTRRVSAATCGLDECTCLPEGETEACNQIVFIRRDGCTIGCDTTGDIWIMNEDGGGERALTSYTRPVYLGNPRWSPDGRQIAYRLIEQSDQTALKVVVLTVATGQEDVVGTIDTVGPMTSIREGPTWSPDGTKIAIEGIYGIHTIDLALGNFMTWLAAPVHYYAPDWSPDGARIAVRMGAAIGIMPSGGGAAVPFVASDVVDPFDRPHKWRAGFGTPRWSPGGDRLVVTADSGGRIAILPAAASGTVRLLKPDPYGDDPNDFGVGIFYADPTWSPDGTRILFALTSYDDSRPFGAQRNDDLWSMADDGTDLQRLTFTGFFDPVLPAFLEGAADW
jgi:hypothetical protein